MSASELVATSSPGSVKSGQIATVRVGGVDLVGEIGRRAHSRVGVFALVSAATVVPHEPAPITPTLIVCVPPDVVPVFMLVPRSARLDRSACARRHRSATHPTRTSYTRRVDVAVLVPVKAFTEAKQRLATVLSAADRIRLARWLADGVVASLGSTPVFVVCDDPDVRDGPTRRAPPRSGRHSSG